MVFDISFNVEFLCDKFDSDKNSEKNVTLNLSVTEKDAENFLFKFTSPVFIFGDYKVLMKYDASFVVKNIVIFDQEYSYVVKNPNIVFSTILEGYIRIKTMNKIGTIMEFEPPIEEELSEECESEINNEDEHPYDDPNYDY